MRFIIFIISIIFSNSFGQSKFKIKTEENEKFETSYYVVDEKGKTLKQLDSAKYIILLDTDDDYRYFAIFGMKNENGWCAIDINENILFKVYNTSYGEPSPDLLVENKIRIVDEKDKIGYANYKGEIIIKPQFEIASSFHKDKAIIGESCEKIPWNLPEELNHSDCHHYSTECKNNGYINEKGNIIELGNFTFEEVAKKINWKYLEN